MLRMFYTQVDNKDMFYITICVDYLQFDFYIDIVFCCSLLLFIHIDCNFKEQRVLACVHTLINVCHGHRGVKIIIRVVCK